MLSSPAFNNRQKLCLQGFTVCVPATFLASAAMRFLSKRPVRTTIFSGLMIDILEFINRNEMISFVIGSNSNQLKIFVKNIRRIAPSTVLKGVIPAEIANFKYHDTLTLLKKTSPDLLILDEDIAFIPKLLKLYQETGDKPRLSLFCGDSLKIYSNTKKTPQERFKNVFFEGFYRLLRRPWTVYRLPYYAIFFLKLVYIKLFDKFETHEL